jgi:hypothetical protein
MITICFVVIALSVGFPIWVYGQLPWSEVERGLFNHGISSILHNYPGSSAIFLVLLICLLASGVSNRRFSSLLAKHTGLIALVAVLLVLVDSLVVSKAGKALYAQAVEARAKLTLSKGFGLLAQQMNLPQAPDVAYFLYLDRQQINALYAEIEPSWLDKQRTLDNSSSKAAKAGLSAGSTSAELSSSRDQRQQLVQQPPEVTPERECVSFMKYAAESGSAAFSTPFEWLIQSLMSVTFSQPREERKEVPLPLSPSEIREAERLAQEMSKPRDEMSISADLAKQNWKGELEARLTQLPQFVFVTGNFVICGTKPIQLVHEYVGPDGNFGVAGERFRPVRFVITFPPSANAPELGERTTIKATVFGRVLQGLDRNGNIEVRAIAIY